MLCVSRPTDVGCQINSGFSATFQMTPIEKRWQAGEERLPQLRCDRIESFAPLVLGAFAPRGLRDWTVGEEDFKLILMSTSAENQLEMIFMYKLLR